MRKEPNVLFYEGSRSDNIKHAQLRMKCSKLNSHLFMLHVTDSPECLCGNNDEDANHYLLYCPLYHIQRQKMLYSLNNDLNINYVDYKLLLYGSDTLDLKTNKSIFKAVHTFISESGRL